MSTGATHPTRHRRARGISLIEALVAMAVMAFGMLGVVGLQATLRGNADLSKQRTEATRIAQERIESWRNFSVLTTTAGYRAFSERVSFPAEDVVGYTTNTTFSVVGSVTPTTPSAHKTLIVDVSWADRAGTAQNVRLLSAMANISPEFGATSVAPPQGAGGVREPGGRGRGIPPQAKNFGDGTSGYRPPQSPAGTVAWLFNNVTGLITHICTTTVTDNALLTLPDLTACVDTTPHQVMSGFIRFSTGGAPTAAGIVNPTSAVFPAAIEAEVVQTAPTAGTIGCFHQYAATYVEYFCAVPVQAPALTWSGSLQIKPATLPQLSGTLADLAAANRKVCRYRAAATYAAVNLPQANENLVVIAAGDGGTAYVCPSPPTFAHQPAT